MAVEAAARFSGECAAVVTMGAQAFVEDHTLDGLRKARVAYATEASLTRLARDHGTKSRWVVDAWVETLARLGLPRLVARCSSSRVSCPILSIHGASDEYGSQEHPRRIAGKSGETAIPDDVGNVPHREAEADVVAVIARFLGRP